MSAVDDLFQELRGAGKKAFMPFLTAGDPDLEFTADIIRELATAGSSLFELGIPYSDPIADGPVIQASYTRALQNGIQIQDILKMISELSSDIAAPLVTMVSYAIVHRYGLRRYVADAKRAGVAGSIVPDLLVEEAADLAGICRQEDFSLIQLVTPTTPKERAIRIAESSTGFLYYVSVTGITGERDAVSAQLVENVGWIRERTALPICIGFGISTPEHVKILAPAADGLIVGSALVRRIAEAGRRPRDEILREVGKFAAQLIEAVNIHP